MLVEKHACRKKCLKKKILVGEMLAVIMKAVTKKNAYRRPEGSKINIEEPY